MRCVSHATWMNLIHTVKFLQLCILASINEPPDSSYRFTQQDTKYIVSKNFTYMKKHMTYMKKNSMRHHYIPHPA